MSNRSVKQFHYMDMVIEYKTQTELLKKMLLGFGLKSTKYIIFYIWCYRNLDSSLSFEEKLKLYLEYRLLKRKLKENKQKDTKDNK